MTCNVFGVTLNLAQSQSHTADSVGRRCGDRHCRAIRIEHRQPTSAKNEAVMWKFYIVW